MMTTSHAHAIVSLAHEITATNLSQTFLNQVESGSPPSHLMESFFKEDTVPPPGVYSPKFQEE